MVEIPVVVGISNTLSLCRLAGLNMLSVTITSHVPRRRGARINGRSSDDSRPVQGFD